MAPNISTAKVNVLDYGANTDGTTDNLVLAREVAIFFEVYGERIPLQEIPKLTVTIGNFRVNGKPVKPVWADAVYPNDVPNYADVTTKDGTLTIKVGHPVQDRKARNVQLIGK